LSNRWSAEVSEPEFARPRSFYTTLRHTAIGATMPPWLRDYVPPTGTTWTFYGRLASCTSSASGTFSTIRLHRPGTTGRPSNC